MEVMTLLGGLFFIIILHLLLEDIPGGRTERRTRRETRKSRRWKRRDRWESSPLEWLRVGVEEKEEQEEQQEEEEKKKEARKEEENRCGLQPQKKEE